MKIVDNGSVPLTNAEVLAHIIYLENKYDAQNRSAGDKKPPDNLSQVIRDVRMNSQMPSQPFKRATFSPEAILELSTTLKSKPWKLLQSEILQILNHVPMTTQEIKFLLEDADLRFKEEELGEMLDVIHKTMKVEKAA